MLNFAKHHAGNLEQFSRMRVVSGGIKAFGGLTNMKECQKGFDYPSEFFNTSRAVPAYSPKFGEREELRKIKEIIASVPTRMALEKLVLTETQRAKTSANLPLTRINTNTFSTSQNVLHLSRFTFITPTHAC